MFKFTVLTLCSLSAFAQGPPVVAGSGYRLPGNTILAASGQVLNVSVYGIAKNLPERTFPTPGNGYPFVVQGISAEFVQGAVAVQLRLQGVQQSPCPLSGPCHPATTLTLQIPDLYAADSRDTGKLVIKADGETAAEVTLQGVTDQVHILNTCDQTGTFFSVAAQLPAGTCRPIVTHARGPLVTSTDPAVPGETLVIWAYGLGALSKPVTNTGCCFNPADVPTAIQPFHVSLLYVRSNASPLLRWGVFTPLWAGTTNAGVYQVHLTVPPVPQDLQEFCPATGNFRISLVGPASSDSAGLCVKP